jgi:predicted metal-binding protein
LFQTYPQFISFKKARKFIDRFDFAVIFIWKNDGTRSWKVNKKELAHIDFKIKKGKQLKGTEVSQSRELCKIMRRYRKVFQDKGYKVFGSIPGHCDFCGHKCPQRSNPPCKRRGMPSMEAMGIDVYKLLEDCHIEYQHPVENYLTNVTMLLLKWPFI